MVFIDLVERDVDELGRIVMPARWRRGMSNHLLLYKFQDEIIIREKKAGVMKKLRGTLEASDKDLREIGRLKSEGATSSPRKLLPKKSLQSPGREAGRQNTR